MPACCLAGPPPPASSLTGLLRTQCVSGDSSPQTITVSSKIVKHYEYNSHLRSPTISTFPCGCAFGQNTLMTVKMLYNNYQENAMINLSGIYSLRKYKPCPYQPGALCFVRRPL